MRKTFRLLALLLALVMALCLIAGCSSGGSSSENPEQTPGNTGNGDPGNTDGPGETTPVSSNGPQYGGHLNVHVYTKPTGLDPVKKTGIWHYPWTTCVYENVLTRDAENNIAPGVCDYTLSDDMLDLKLWVRDGMTFHNGDTVDIEDVMASINRSCNGFGTNCTKYIGEYINTMEIEGDVLHITFKSYHEKTMYYLASYQTWISVMPKEICEKYNGIQIFDQIEDAIGTGPYKLADFQDSTYITVEKYADYTPCPEGRTGFASPKMGYLDSITFWYNGDNSSATLALLEGSYDITDVIVREYQDMAYSQGIVLDSYNSNTGVMMIFNTQGEGNVCAKYPSLRKAVMAAIDYEEFLEVICDGSQIIGGQICLDPLYATDIFTQADYYGPDNQEVVDKYLAAAKEEGYNGAPLQLCISNGKPDIATMLKGYLDHAGINYELSMREPTAQTQFVGSPSNNWDFYFTWPNYNYTPTLLQASIMENNYKSAEKDRLLAEMEKMEVGSQEYIEKWHELAQQMVDDCASVHMGTIHWFWYHPNTFHSNDEGLVRYFFNSYWDDPQNHTA